MQRLQQFMLKMHHVSKKDFCINFFVHALLKTLVTELRHIV